MDLVEESEMDELQIWQDGRSFSIFDVQKNLLYTAKAGLLPNARFVLRNLEGREVGAVKSVIVKPSLSALFLEGLMRHELSFPNGETERLRGESFAEKKKNGIRQALKSQLFPTLILDKREWRIVRSLMGANYQIIGKDGRLLARIKQTTFPGYGLRPDYIYQYILSYGNQEDEVMLLLIVLAIGKMAKLRDQSGYAE